MNITLTENHEAWIAAQVAHGVYKSPDEAVQQLIDQHLLSEQIVDDDDIAWMKPLVDEALAKLDAGEQGLSLEAHRARTDKFMQRLQAKTEVNG